jgi:3-hydroxyacyl-[acyl-carrier-protein] dehydratase
VNDTRKNFEDIKKVLPHRYPFLLIDKVLLVDDKSIKALKNVTANEPFFMGHFPNFAVMPGVLQIEAMAQAGGLILAYQEDFDAKSDLALLVGIDNAKFRRMVIPGDQLLIDATIAAKKKNIVKVAAKATVDGDLASSVEITLAIRKE